MSLFVKKIKFNFFYKFITLYLCHNITIVNYYCPSHHLKE